MAKKYLERLRRHQIFCLVKDCMAQDKVSKVFLGVPAMMGCRSEATAECDCGTGVGNKYMMMNEVGEP